MTPRDRIAQARAIQRENEGLPEVLRLNHDGSLRHPFRRAFALAQMGTLNRQLDEVHRGLQSQDEATRTIAEAQLARLSRQMDALEGPH